MGRKEESWGRADEAEVPTGEGRRRDHLGRRAENGDLGVDWGALVGRSRMTWWTFLYAGVVEAEPSLLEEPERAQARARQT